VLADRIEHAEENVALFRNPQLTTATLAGDD
jgi:hypothetical protein